MHKHLLLPVVAIVVLSHASLAAGIDRSSKSFVRNINVREFKNVDPAGDGFTRLYTVGGAEVYDIDENKVVKNNITALLCLEGNKKNGLKDGSFSQYLIDSADHTKKYKIRELVYNNGKLDGKCKTFAITGLMIGYQNYKDDVLYGISRSFWVDGETITDEIEYLHGVGRYIKRSYYDNGEPCLEAMFENYVMSGPAKKFYSNGTLKEFAMFKNGKFDGPRRLFYPNAQLSTEEVFKEGKHWTIRNNYNREGYRRDGGTLTDGNGTLILYNENGTILEVKHYKNGDEKL